MSFRRLCHWGPLAVLCIIKLITWDMIHLIGMWWPPSESFSGSLHATMFLLLSAFTLYHFLMSLFEGPGFVPKGWKPDNEADTKFLQFCFVCNGYKAPRSHHCRKCGNCVMKMDHHCPWINTCVGHYNHYSFTKFLICAVFGCLHASIVLSICLYHAIHRVHYMRHGTGSEPLVFLTLATLLLSLLALGMAIGVVLACGALLYIQIKNILTNRTTIEDYIMDKAVMRRAEHNLPPFVFPYDLGWRENLKLVLHGQHFDGIRWPLADNCDEYDLTREQIAQKADKWCRSRVYRAAARYSGYRVPLCAWPRAACAAPCTDEARLPLAPGDAVRVTRQRKYWMFGEKLIGPGEGAGAGAGEGGRGPRGWFPRAAAVPSAPPAPRRKGD